MKKLLSSLLFALCFGVAFSSAYADDVCKNLFDPETMLVAHAFVRAGNTSVEKPLGIEAPASSWSCSTYIKVKPNTIYTYTLPSFMAAGAAGLVCYSDTTVESAISGKNTDGQGSATYTFTTPANCNYIRFSWPTSNGDGVQLEEGSTATAYQPYNPLCATCDGTVVVENDESRCIPPIKIATTAYSDTQFAPVETALAGAVATIREIVTNTINQTAAIASLQADKQTRPEDACPAGKKCLLVETEENGVVVPHWFPIIEAPEE